MPTVQCCVVGCTNGTYKFNKWNYSHCAIHNCLHSEPSCDCQRPFTMLTFPKDEAIRNQWLMNINRVETTSRTIKIKDIHSGNLLHKEQQKGNRWEANVNAKICSIHFIDGKSTSANPYPTENMGHTSNCLKIKKRKEPLQRSPYVTNSSKKRKITKLDNNITSDIKGHSDAFLETKKEEQNYCLSVTGRMIASVEVMRNSY